MTVVVVFADELESTINSVVGDPAIVNENGDENKNSQNTSSKDNSSKISEKSFYIPGDWEKYINEPSRKDYTSSEKGKNELFLTFNAPLTFSYGVSSFTDDKYKLNDEDSAESSYVNNGFSPFVSYTLIAQGYADETLYVNIDHDSERDPEMNVYEIIYKAPNEEDFLREFRIGDIELKFADSEFVRMDTENYRTEGASALFENEKIKIKVFGVVNDAETTVDYFQGFSSKQEISLRDYQYVRRKYFQIEPYKRYDGRTSPPPVSTIAERNDLVVFTSDPPSASPPISYENYSLTSVNLKSGSVEVFISDGGVDNNVLCTVDNFYYKKLQEGRDYSINYTTGQLTLFYSAGVSDRIYVLYDTESGSSSDPALINYSGKKMVFVYYAGQMNTDINSDGSVNYDVYEIKSIYSTGSVDINSNANIVFYKENSLLTETAISSLGNYSVNNSSGVVSFDLREPFRKILSNPDKIYSQIKSSSIFSYSQYKTLIEYSIKGARIRLSHMDIVPDSVVIKVNGVVVEDSNYSVNNLTGEIIFNETFAATISPSAPIEVHYKYKSPGGVSERNFIVGGRVEYKLNDSVRVGTSAIYSADSTVMEVPDAGEEPEALFTGEVDAELTFSPSQISKFFYPATGIKRLPVEFRGYYEYARSVYIINTFGTAMIDDFDSAGSGLQINLSEKEWIISAPPLARNQNERGILSYKYYRDPDDNYSLQESGFSFYDIDYSIKTGPYNIADKYYANYEYSLVLDFNFDAGDNFSSIITQRLSDSVVDISDLQYIEIIYRAASGSGTVNLTIDAGRFNEDSDGDGVLDTEDSNYNGYLDLSTGNSEDNGYYFNPLGEPSTYVGSGPYINSSTKGDGKLATEDVNSNGKLDSEEEYLSFPSGKSFVEGNPANTTLSVDLSDRSWKKIRIYPDRTNMTEADYANLSRVEALRLWIDSTLGSESGEIYISSINVATLNWNLIKIDGVESYNPERFQVNYVSTENDSVYRQNSFLKDKTNEYEMLYGENSVSEPDSMVEGALELIYDSINGYSDGVSVKRKLTKPIDISRYEELVFWINQRTYSAGDTIEIEIGSDENNYRTYSIDCPGNSLWNKIALKIMDPSDSSISYVEKGNIDMTALQFIRLRLKGTTGKLWINNIHVSKPRNVTGQAFYTENTISVTSPFYKDSQGIEYFGNTDFTYSYRQTDSDFNSLTHDSYGYLTKTHFFKTTTMPLPYAFTEFSFSNNSFKEEVHPVYNSSGNQRMFIFSQRVVPRNEKYPDFGLMYTQLNSENSNYEFIDTDLYRHQSNYDDFSVAVYVNEDNFKIGNSQLVYYLGLNTSYNNSIDDYIFEYGVSSLNEKNTEKLIQVSEFKSGFEFINKLYEFGTNFKIKNNIVSNYSGFNISPGDTIQEEIDCDVYFPFFYHNKYYKNILRNYSLEPSFSLKWLEYTDIDYIFKMESIDDNFRDYSSSNLLKDKFSRSRDGSYDINQELAFPLKLEKTRFKNISQFRFSYRRNLGSNENNIPYEGEGWNYFNEEFGFRKAGVEMLSSAFNYYDYYPFYFLGGSKFCSNGRVIAEDTINKHYNYNGNVIEEYDNTFQAEDSFEIETEYSLKAITIDYGFLLKNFVKRDSLENVPGQNLMVTNNFNFMIELFRHCNWKGRNEKQLELSLGYNNRNNLMITSNNYETTHSPSIGINYAEKMFSLNFTTGFDFIRNTSYEFIDPNIDNPANPDYIYSQNLNSYSFKKHDYSYNFEVIYLQKVQFLKPYKDSVYKSDDYPEFKFTAGMKLNFYDYENSVSPEPYNFYYSEAVLSSYTSKYTQFLIFGKGALEQYYNRDNGDKYREIISFEAGFSFIILF